MTEQPNSARVSLALNTLLTLALIFQDFVALHLFAPQRPNATRANISAFPPFRDHPILELVAGLVAIACAAILFVWLLQTIWNRVLARQFGLQALSFSAAYAISILFFAMASWL